MHVHLVCYGSSQKHEKFIKDVSKWEYPIEGNFRKGTCSPVISEVKFYDVRIMKEAGPQFLTDMNAFTLDSSLTPNKKHKTFQRYAIRFIIWILDKLTGSHRVHRVEKPLHQLEPWFYVFNTMNFHDPVQEDPVTKTKKEVL